MGFVEKLKQWWLDFSRPPEMDDDEVSHEPPDLREYFKSPPKPPEPRDSTVPPWVP